jgi:hypothetical protein
VDFERTSIPSETHPAAASAAPPGKPMNMRTALWGFLLLDIWVRLTLWSTSLWLTTAAFHAMDAWPAGNPLGSDLGVTRLWAVRISQWVLLFNVVYLLLLLLVRLPIPTPREGVYPTNKPGLPDRQLIWATLLGVLTKARYQAPFPGFLVFHLANLPPLCWLASRIFGPKSASCYVTEPEVLDPFLVEIGRNCIIGYGAVIAGHMQEPDKVTIRRTVIEDDVLVGGKTLIMAGVRLGQGCVIGARSFILPGTVVGPHEFWAGSPAKKIGMVRQEGTPQGD